MKSAIDAGINNEIFRNDFSQVIALRRDLAAFTSGRLTDASADYPAGQVLSYNSGTSQYQKYAAATSGTYPAVAVLYQKVASTEFSATGGALAVLITAGHVYKDALTNYDAGSKSQLDAKEYIDASGTTIVKF